MSGSGNRCWAYPTTRTSRAPGRPEQAVLTVWTPVPDGLAVVNAAALPMAVETAHRCLDLLDPRKGQVLFVYGARTVIGFAAVQMALMRGLRVIAAAGHVFAGRLRARGAEVIAYGDGMAERVATTASGRPDLIFDAGPVSDVLPDLVRIAAGDSGRVLTVSNHGEAAQALGVRNSFRSGLRYDVLPRFAALAA